MSNDSEATIAAQHTSKALHEALAMKDDTPSAITVEYADGTELRVPVEVGTEPETDDASPARDESDDDGSPLDGIAADTGTVTDAQETRDGDGPLAGIAPADETEEPADGDEICGAECADGTPCQNGPDCHLHTGDDDADETSDSDGSEPETAYDFMLANGPCIACANEGSSEPCSYGARDGETPFCAMHGRVSDPDIHAGAYEAFEAFLAGDDAAVKAHADEHAGR